MSCLPGYSLFLWGMFYFVCVLLSVSFMMSIGSFFMFLVEWELFECCGCVFSLSVLVDSVSLTFSCVVCLISVCVYLFSVSYMESEDPCSLRRFGLLVGGFVCSMNLLIYVPSLVSLMVGWDWLGIISFILVIYYKNKASLSAGMLTVLTNRLGDVFLILSIGLCLCWGDWGVLTISGAWGYAFFLSVLVACAGMTKSAQIPFCSWLPAAMAAPTPVSSLVHSSTLVTAGVYLLFRFYGVLSGVGGVLWVLGKVACLTLLMSSLCACCEVDTKKLIALSTMSHLSFMVYSLSAGYPDLAIFHLFNHALFKSLLFLCAGFMIHVGDSCQDMRQLSGSSGFCFVFSCMILSCNALCGVPFMSGFYSKDGILESCFVGGIGVIEVACVLVSACMSSLYSTRLVMGMLGGCGKLAVGLTCNEPFLVFFPCLVLAIGSVVFGWFCQAVEVWACCSFVLDPVIKTSLFVVVNLGSFVAVSGVLESGYHGHGKLVYLVSNVLSLTSSSMWFLRPLVSGLVVGFGLEWGLTGCLVLECGWMEVLGGQGMHKLVLGLLKKMLTFDGVGGALSVVRLSACVVMGLIVLKSFLCILWIKFWMNS
uniref:NADH-ubiquinone oxidoreductase chain 5 n=1 Tax=Echyridella menziesii TaxID=981778 RepID=A0A1X9JP89_9BIVA|nr:NADH dehydrogenase subunit 5 [Echyridella menziesii]